MTGRYVPEAGDIVWLQFDPQAGHEQAGHRPALVLSPSNYNARRGMMVCCPMTSRIKGYVFEVVVPGQEPSAVLADQVKSLDWVARRATRKGVASPEVLAEVRAKLKALLNF
ncbi:endoribonuclease MazF [Caulobacter sp. DWR1-3-2b1]|uniref:endoribonuclease MazF n=1 Tax=Caulobacter sp. DWR1-3-2b1 TaxID=2804670 RepID=UPI003CF7551B